MKRDIMKSINEYNRRFLNRNTTEGAFYAGDLYQIKDLAETLGGGRDRIYYMISLSLKAGFMVGYRNALRKQRKSKG